MVHCSRWLTPLIAACLAILTTCGPSSASSSSPARSSGAAPAPQAAASATSAASPELQALVDGARQEGSLSLVWGEGTVGGTQGTRRLAERFNQHYGLNLDVRFTPGPNMPNMAAKVAEEYAAGRPASSDLYLGYGGYIVTLLNADALLPVDWAGWAANVQDPRFVDGGGRAVAVQTSLHGITYNTNRVRPDEVPRSLQDLLKPQYKGRIASTPYAAGFDRLPIPEFWGEQRTMEYMTRFAEQLAGLIRCNEIERVASGEFEILALDCGQGQSLTAKANGAPTGFTMATDAPFAQIMYLAVPRNAAHPNAAKLWINYMLSREAQDIVYELHFADLHWLPGSKSATDIASFAGPGVAPVEFGVDFYLKHDESELDRPRAEIQRLLAKR
jgi:ABC-type Fe3+ transport system substrate-binding protein